MITAKEARLLSNKSSEALTETLERADRNIENAALLGSTHCSIMVAPEITWVFQIRMKQAGYKIKDVTPTSCILDWSNS